MQPVEFLSDAWIDEAQRLGAALADNPVSTEGFVVNATISGVPFGTGTLHLHSTTGPMVGWHHGHAPEPVVSFETDYHYAKALILDMSPTLTVLESEVASGALRISGDVDALRRWFATRRINVEAVAVEDAIRAMTL